VAAAGAAMLAGGLAGLAALFVNIGILRAAGDASGPGRLMVGPVVQQVSEVDVSPAPDPETALQPSTTPQLQPAGGWSSASTGSGPSLTGGGAEPEGEPTPLGTEHSFRSGGDD
jgi:hypothetical protein